MWVQLVLEFLSEEKNLQMWDLLTQSIPESYNLPSFKFKINKLDLVSLSY